MDRKRVGIVLFDDVEVLDFCGPFEVFSVTRLADNNRRDSPSPFEVLLVAERAGPITANGGMTVTPHRTFETCPPLDVIVAPGGWGTRQEMKNPVMLDWLRTRAAEAETVTSVCTGSLLLGHAGLLDGLHATTHWQALDLMRDSLPSVTVEYDKHFVQDGRVLTSAGISAGIDMALKVVERYFGEGVARATARYMEFPYPESDARRVQL
jgi:transcriptional regulator GlxA family with amidase domain